MSLEQAREAAEHSAQAAKEKAQDAFTAGTNAVADAFLAAVEAGKDTRPPYGYKANKLTIAGLLAECANDVERDLLFKACVAAQRCQDAQAAGALREFLSAFAESYGAEHAEAYLAEQPVEFNEPEPADFH